MDAGVVYVLAEEGVKVSHNTRVEWFIGNLNKKIVFSEPDAPGICLDQDTDSVSQDTGRVQPVDWNVLTLAAASPSLFPQKFPLTYYLRPSTTVKFLAQAYRIVFVIDLSSSMFQPSSSGYCPLHHATISIETTLRRLIPENCNLELPLKQAYLKKLSLFISIIGVVPGRQSFTIIHDWEAERAGLGAVMYTVAQKLFHLEATEELLRPQSTQGDKAASMRSALVDLLRHGALTLAMQKPDWAPASLVIVSDGCLDTYDMVELDRSLAHLRAEAIRCCFIVLFPYDYQSKAWSTELSAPRGLFMALSSGPCVAQYDLCRFIAHATAGFCLANPSQRWKSLQEAPESPSTWNSVHELFLALKLQDDASSDPSKEGDQGWTPLEQIRPFSRVVHASITNVLASRLKDGYRLRSASVFVHRTQTSIALSQRNGLNPEMGMEEIAHQSKFPVPRNPHVQLELVLAWKPGVIFNYFLCGEWYLPIGNLPILQQTSGSPLFVPPQKGISLPTQPAYYQRGRQSLDASHQDSPESNAPYCVANLRVLASYSFIREVTNDRKRPLLNNYRRSVLDRFAFHLRLLNHVDDYLEKVSSFNLNPSIYRVPSQYVNGLSPVFLTVQAPGGNLEIHLAGNLTEDPAREQPGKSASLSRFASYWKSLLSLDIANCYRWMHTDTIYILLEHDSPLPQNLFIPASGRRGMNTLSFRQSLSRIHNMFSEWGSFVLLENHTYIKFESPSCADTLSTSDNDLSKDSKLLETSDPSAPSYFTLVRLEMKLPEIRVRIAFAAGIPSDLRRATLQHLSEQLRSLSFPPRGKQTFPKSRHKSGNFHHPSDAEVHVPPLQRSWAETPCCIVVRSRLDRLVVETGTYSGAKIRAIHSSTAEHSSIRKGSSQLTKCAVSEVRCDVSPSLLKQHLYHMARIWVLPLHSKSANCIQKIFTTLMNLRIQEGFHFVRSGPLPGFISLVKEILFTTDSVNSDAQPCLVQYQLYPFHPRSCRTFLLDSDTENSGEIQKAAQDVQRLLDHMLPVVPPTVLSTLKSLTASHHSSEFQIVSEVWIEPKHGRTFCLSREADYLTHLSYKQVAHRMLQLDSACMSAYLTLESLLNSCLLKIIRFRRSTGDAVGSKTPSKSSLVEETAEKLRRRMSEGPVKGTVDSVTPVPFELTNLIAVAPQLCLIYPLPIDPALMSADGNKLNYLATENLLVRLFLNLDQRMPHVAAIPMTTADSEAFDNFLISSHSSSSQGTLRQLLKNSPVPEWKCFAAVFGLQDPVDSLDREGVDLRSAAIAFFFLPANHDAAVSAFTQAIVTTLQPSTRCSSGSFPIFVFSCSHTYLSFLLDDRWTYTRPTRVVVDCLLHPAGEGIHSVVDRSGSLFFTHDSLPARAPQTLLDTAKGNTRLTHELVSLWRCLRETTVLLMGLCDESFVESIHRALDRGFPLSNNVLRMVLFSDRFCSSLRPIKIDATDFLCATCSHCFNALKRSQPEAGNFSDSKGRVFGCDASVPCQSTALEKCGLRINDHPRIHARLASVINQFFAPVPQFPGFYFFRISDFANVPTFSDELSGAVRALNLATQTTYEPRFNKNSGSPHVVFSASPVSDEDAHNVSNPHSPIQSPQPNLLLTTKPLFLKLVVYLSYCGASVNLPVEDLPFCLLDHIPSLTKSVDNHKDNALLSEVRLKDIRLEVAFIPRVWRPNSTSMPDGAADKLQNGEQFSETKFSTVEEEEEGEQETSEDTSSESQCSSASDTDFASAQRGGLADPAISYRTSGKIGTDEELDFNESQFAPYLCDCIIDPSVDWEPACDLCRALTCADTIRYLNMEQRTALQQTVLVFRWLLKDEVVCSLRLLHPVSQHALELVLQHMETTNMLLVNSAPALGPGVQTHLVPKSGQAIPLMPHQELPQSVHFGRMIEFDALEELTAGIKFDSVSLSFVVNTDKAMPKFINKLESISFRSSRGKLVRLNEYYVVCSLMPPKEKTFAFDSPQPSMQNHQACEEADCPTSPFIMKKSELATILSRSRSDGELYETGNQLAQQILGLSCGANICCSAVKEEADVLSTFSSTPQRNLHNFFPGARCSLQFSGQAGYDGDSSATESETFEPPDVKPPTVTTMSSLHGQMPASTGLSSTTNLFGSSSFPPQKSDRPDHAHLKRRSFSNRLAYWLIFRVGSSSVTAYFHHSDTHCERGPIGSGGSDCLYCPVFQKAIKDLKEAVTFVNRTLLLDQLSTERMCDPLLLPDDTDEVGNGSRQRPFDSFLNPKARRVNRKRFVPSQRSPCTTDPLMSASSTTDTDSAAVGVPVSQRLHQRISAPTSSPSNKRKRLQIYQDTKINATEVGPTSHPAKSMNLTPGMFACPTQFVIRIELHPRASSAGERGHRVLPELRRLLENFAVLNRANMFFLIDSQEARAERSVTANLTAAASAHAQKTNSQQLISNFTATGLSATEPKRRASAFGASSSSPNSASSQNRTFYMLLKEVTDSTGEFPHHQGLGPSGCYFSPVGGQILRRESLPANLPLSGRPHPVCSPAFAPATNSPTGTRTILQATLHGISPPSRHLYASVRQLLQTQLDKIVLQRLSEALSRNALNRLTLPDLDFFFSRCWDHPHLRLVTHLPDLFGHSVAHINIPTGALLLAFSQYLKQNLLLFTHQAKPERELTTFLRERLGCGELLLYNRPRGLGVAKSGIAAVLVSILEKRQTSEMKPYKVRFFVEPHEWLHRTLTSSVEAFTFDELYAFLTHIHFSPDSKTPTENGGRVTQSQANHLVVKFQIWERGDANVSHLIDRLKSAVRHAVFDLITEYFILTQPLATIEVPIFKTRSAGPPPVEALPRKTTVTACASSSFISSYFLSSNSVQMSSYLVNVLMPWLEVARVLETPLVTIKNFLLHSDLSIRFLVSELVSQLNLLVEEANGAFGGIHLTKCPVLSTMMSSPSARSTDTQSRTGAARSLSSCLQPSCSCLRSVNFFAFESKSTSADSSSCCMSNLEENSAGSQWTTLSLSPAETAYSGTRKIAPGQRREYLLIGRNYSICKFQSTLDAMYHNLRARMGQQQPPTPTSSGEDPGKQSAKVSCSDPITLPTGFVPVRPVSTCPGRVPLQRQQPLEIQMQVLPERVAAGHTREHSADQVRERPPTINSPHENSHISNDSTSAVSTSHGSLNNLCDMPEFCEIQLCLPENRLSPPSTTSLPSPTTADLDTPSRSESPFGGGGPGHGRSQMASLCIPRQAVCLIHIKGHVLTVYTYNWLRDELDRLMARVETLVNWYNQRFQLLECLSTQKMGLFHNLRGSRYRTLLQRMSELGRLTSSPELSPKASTSETANNVKVPSASSAGTAATVLSTGAVRRRTAAVTPQTVPGVTSFTRSGLAPTLADYQVQEAVNQQRNPDDNQTYLTRIFQDCAHVPALLPVNASHPQPVDIVHNHVLQALETVERDRQRAHHLQLITTPLELCFRSGNSARSSSSAGDSAESLSPNQLFASGLSDDVKGRSRKDECATDAGVAGVLFSAVKRISRTLHTVCAPILLSPMALAEALRVLAQEQAAEANYALLQEQQELLQEQRTDRHVDTTIDDPLAGDRQPEHRGSVVETTGSLTATSSTWTAEATDAGASSVSSLPSRRRRRSLRLFTVTFKDEPPRGRPQSYSIPRGELQSGYPAAVSIPTTVSVKAGRRQQKLQQPSLPSPRAASANAALFVDAAQTLSSPPWLIEADNTLLFEYIQYITSQVHFSVIRSSLRENPKSTRPYALLQRSIQMAGVHLIEVFVRDHLFCVRLRAVELWRFSRRASRALMTGPLSSSILGQAAATAAATMASAILAVDRSTTSVSSLTGGVFNGAAAVGQTQLESFTGPRGLSPPQASQNQQQQLGLLLNKIGKRSLKMLAETSKWEESSRLCDCTHLHSFLYDFYLRHVDAYLRRHSDLIGQRESPSLLFKSMNSTATGDPLSAFSSPRSHAFLPNGYPVLQFLEHLELLSRTPPVFARGTFGRIRLAVSIGTRIKPEQVFDHLIDERHVYGLKAFELGNRRTGGSISAHHHLGICAFSEDTGQQQQPQHMNTRLSFKSSLLTSNRRPGQPLHAPFGRHLLRGDSKPELTTSATSPVVFSESSLSEEEEEDDDESEEEEENEQQGKAVGSSAKGLGSGEGVEGMGVSPTSGRGPNPATTPAARCLPRFKLPQTSFSVASVVFFDAAQSQLPSQQQKSQDSVNDGSTANSYMTLSIFILLTDRQKRYPRTRLSSLPEGLPSKHTAPVHWPAIRPSFSFHSDLNKIPSLQRSGSHESAKSIVDDSDTKFSASKGPRIRHTSLMIRTKQETTEMENPLQRYSLNIQDLRGRQPTMADPGLRWKISYLGVWPSHQINLSRAFTRISNAWRKAIPEITNLAILNCHKNFLWYRLFDPKYFPLQCCFETRGLEQGEDIVASQSTAKPLQTNVHRGLTLEEFKDLIGSAPQQTDLLRMDHRLGELLEIGCEHLSDMVASINALWQASNNSNNGGGGSSSGSERLVAFLYEEPEMAPPPLEATNGNTCWRMHLGLIAPSFPEGLVLLRWTEIHDLEKVEPPPPPSPSLGSSILGTPLSPPAEAPLRALSHRYLPAPVEGTSLDYDAPGRRKCSNFSMKAIFRSTNTSDVIAPRTGMLSVSSSAQRMYDMAYQRSFLLPLVKKLVEHLSFFVWKDLH